MEEQIGAASASGIRTLDPWPPNDSPISITTDLTRQGTEVSLVRVMACGDEAAHVDVCWTRDHADTLDSGTTFDALAPHRSDFAFWSAGALALGRDWISERLEGIIAADAAERAAERERRAREDEETRTREEEEREYEASVHAFFKERKGWFVVEFRKGRARDPFWTIRFEEAWERDRFWDWMAWQLGRHDEMAAFLAENQPLDLERRLLREMLATELAAKKAGLGAGGRSPLRFWRGEL